MANQGEARLLDIEDGDVPALWSDIDPSQAGIDRQYIRPLSGGCAGDRVRVPASSVRISRWLFSQAINALWPSGCRRRPWAR